MAMGRSDKYAGIESGVPLSSWHIILSYSVVVFDLGHPNGLLVRGHRFHGQPNFYLSGSGVLA